MSTDSHERAPLLSEYEQGTTTEDTAAIAPPADQSLSSRIRTALNNPKALTGLEKALALLAVFFLLLTATFSGLFAGEAVKYKHEKQARRHDRQHHHPGRPTATVTATTTIGGPTATPLPPPKHPKSGEVCLTGSCVQSASKIISSLHTSINPCDDFYSFANGGWLDNHPIPAGQGSFGTFQQVDQNNKRIIRDIINAAPDSSLPQADQNNLAHLRAFWQSCTDEEGLDKQGSKPLFDLVDEVISAWRGEHSLEEDEEDELLFIQPIGEEFISHKKKGKAPKRGGKWDPKTKRERLTNALTLLHSRAISALFEGYTEGDVGAHPSTNVLWLSQGGLSLPSKDYYGDKDTVAFYENVATQILEEVYRERHELGVTAKDLAAGVVKLEKAIAKVSLDAADLDLPIPTYNPLNASTLQVLFPSISFANYFASFGPRPRFPDPVVVTSPGFFANLTEILEGTGPDALEAYFVVQTALSYGDLLGAKQPIRKQVDLFSNKINGIAPDSHKPRDELCLDAALESYGFLIGRPFVQRAFPGESKAYAENIIHAIIRAFKDRLPGRSWLDEETRKKAQEKVEAITVKIGYPTSPNTTDPASIERYYSLNLPIKADDYFGNILRSRVADEKRKWAKVGRERDAGEWEMVPSEVNAYYQPSDNSINFPAGISQPPFFSVDWPEYLNFASFGSVSGHELTHSLDQAGRLYDKDGKLFDWWSSKTSARFNERQKCFRDQYRRYHVIGPDGKEYPIDSQLTGGEDGADAGGLAQAFTAWQARLKDDPEGKKYKNYALPGLAEYSKEQLFFIAYAQGWARAVTPGEALRRIRTDPHSPTNFRVIGPLSNNAEFAKAFNCPVGSVMNRGEEKRCEIW
ncbi:hypothetical protein JCM11251_005829 [Rhodosporidiobolus azoricus]